MKIGLVSAIFIDTDIVANVNTIIKTLEENSTVDYLFFGEAFLQGFDGISFNYEEDKKIAIDIESEYIQYLQDQCSKYETGIGFGFYELVNLNIYCSYLIIGKDGKIINNYRRISKGWKTEKANEFYLEGDQFAAFNLDGYEFAIAICGDLWDEYNLERLKEIKFDFLLWPNYNSYSIEFWENSEKQEYLLQASKVAKNVFWINSHNNGKDKSFGGAIYFKNNVIEQELPMGKTGVLVFDL